MPSATPGDRGIPRRARGAEPARAGDAHGDRAERAARATGAARGGSSAARRRARLVIAYVKDVALNLRNLSWLRELESPRGSPEREVLALVREDAQSLVEVTRSRELGIPTFVLGSLLAPAALSLWRLASGVTFEHWWIALAAGCLGVAVGHPALGAGAARRALGDRRPLWPPSPRPLATLRRRRRLPHDRGLGRASRGRDRLAHRVTSAAERRVRTR